MAELYYSPFIPQFSGNGLPVAGAKLHFFYTGTESHAPIYSDVSLSIPMDNPVVSDLAGRYPNIYLNESTIYRVRATTSSDSPLGADIDPYIPGTALRGPVGPEGPAGNEEALVNLSTTATVVAYDSFDRSDRLLDGDTSDSGNVWSVQGSPSTVRIVDGQMYSTTGQNFYAQLPLSDQPRRVQVRGKWLPTGITPSVAANETNSIVIILTDGSGITQNSAVHCQCTPNGMTLDHFRSGVSYLGVGGVNFAEPLQADGSEYQFAIELSADGTEVTCIGPKGERQTTTISQNAAITCDILGIQETAWNLGGGIGPYGAHSRVIGVEVGEISRTNRALAFSSPAYQNAVPSSYFHRTTIAPEAMITANGAYRIAFEKGGLGGFNCIGDVEIEAEHTAAPGYSDFIKIDASVTASAQRLTQIDRKNVGTLISSVVGSHNGSTAAVIDVVITNASPSSPVRLRVWLRGVLTRSLFPSAGATPYSNVVTLVPSASAGAQSMSAIISTTGYARIARGNSAFRMVGGMFLYASDPSGLEGYAQITFGGAYNRTPSISRVTYNLISFGTIFGNARISTDSSDVSPTGVGLDIEFPNATAQPVALSATFTPGTNGSLVLTPPTNVAALPTANNTVALY